MYIKYTNKPFPAAFGYEDKELWDILSEEFISAFYKEMKRISVADALLTVKMLEKDLTFTKKSDNYNVSTSERTTDYPRPFEYNKKDPDNGRD